MTTISALIWSALLTWVMVLVAGLVRTKAWTPAGMLVAFGNRENLPPESPVAGRADRAARNMMESFLLFTALVAAAHFAGKANAEANLGATIFFWARLAYWPCYVAGIIYLRTAIWAVAVVGLAMILFAAL